MGESNNSLISVIVPVHNTEQYLERCVESILNQTYKEIEVILVNDGSSDMSGEKCDRMAKENSRIRVIHRTNKGPGEARNAGLEAAQGAWIGFVDSDDRIEPDMYEKLHSTATGSGKLVSGCGYALWRGNDITKAVHPDIPAIVTLELYFEYLNREVCDFVSVCQKLYHRSIFEGSGGVRFLPQCMYGEDHLFVVEVLLAAGEFVYIPEALYWYCVRGNSEVYSNFSKRKLTAYYAAERAISLLEPVSPYLVRLEKIEYTSFAIGMMWNACWSKDYSYIPEIRKEISRFAGIYLLSAKTPVKRKLRCLAALICPKTAAGIFSKRASKIMQ